MVRGGMQAHGRTCRTSTASLPGPPLLLTLPLAPLDLEQCLALLLALLGGHVAAALVLSLSPLALPLLLEIPEGPEDRQLHVRAAIEDAHEERGELPRDDRELVTRRGERPPLATHPVDPGDLVDLLVPGRLVHHVRRPDAGEHALGGDLAEDATV